MSCEGDWAEWEEFVERLARDLAPALSRRLRRARFERLSGLGPPSEKLVYIYLASTEPQSFTTIRRGLDLSGKTVDKALRNLKDRGLVSLDGRFLYWIREMP
ncbi:MAG: helix-turn-helix transcriptional regulator [Deltaproteobacteria bacterium]|nr:helix-turn-helix transcriptional regulator [Deltaproteobacteria bacterium]